LISIKIPTKNPEGLILGLILSSIQHLAFGIFVNNFSTEIRMLFIKLLMTEVAAILIREEHWKTKYGESVEQEIKRTRNTRKQTSTEVKKSGD